MQNKSTHNNKKDFFGEKIKERLEDYEFPVEYKEWDGWNELKPLLKQKNTKRKPWLLGISITTITAIAIFSALYLHSNSDKDTYPTKYIEEQNSKNIVQEKLTNPELGEKELQKNNDLLISIMQETEENNKITQEAKSSETGNNDIKTKNKKSITENNYEETSENTTKNISKVYAEPLNAIEQNSQQEASILQEEANDSLAENNILQIDSIIGNKHVTQETDTVYVLIVSVKKTDESTNKNAFKKNRNKKRNLNNKQKRK